MSLAFPIPRQTRQVILAASAGQTEFGPADFVLYDEADVQVWIKPVGQTTFSLLDSSAYSVTPAAPFAALPAYFVVTLAAPRAQSDFVWIKGTRLGSRTTDVTRAGRLLSQPLESELDQQVATEQELRRDIDALIAGGANAALIASGVANDSTVQGGTLAEALDFLQQAISADVRALDYGVAEGVPDIGPGLQRAINAAAAKGCVRVIMPPGKLTQLTPVYLNRWSAPGPLTVPGLQIAGDLRGTTIIDTGIANNHAIQVNPEWQRAFKALAGITAGASGVLVTAAHYVQITVTDPAGNEIFVTLPKQIAVNSPGSISVNLPATNPGYSYNLYCDTAAQPAHYAVVAGADARRVAGGQTVTITGIGSAHAVPTDKFAIWQEAMISDLSFTNATAAANASAILFFKAGYSSVERCYFNGLSKDGFTCPDYVGDADGSFNVTLWKCKFDNIGGWAINAAGAALELSNFTVDECQFNLCGTLPANLNTNVAIAAISNGPAPVVSTGASPHGFNVHDQIALAAITGMSLPAGWYRVGSVVSPTSFTLVDLNGVSIDTSLLGAYTGGGTVSLAWRPAVWDPVNLTTNGSGAIAWMGLIGTFTNLDFTQCKNVDIYMSENGSSDNITVHGIDFENTYGKALYIASLLGGTISGIEILSTAAVGATIAGVQLGTGFAGGGVKGLTIDGVKVRSDVSPCMAFEQFQNTNVGGAFVDSNRVRNVTWQTFDAPGQSRFNGFKFDGILGLAHFSITAQNVATLIPTGFGATMPLKLAKTGEWVAYHVPASGITATGIGGLTPNTAYDFYLSSTANAGQPIAGALQVSGEPPGIDPEGYAVKSTDSTFLLVGTWATDGAGNFQPNGSGGSQYPPSGLSAHTVTRGTLSQGVALSVIANPTNAAADEQDLAAAANESFLLRRGNALLFSTIDLSQSAAFNSTILGVANGGTGRATLTAHGLLIGEGAGGINQTAAGAAGTVVVGQGAADPLFTSQPQLGTPGAALGTLILANLTSGTITVSPPAGALGAVQNTLQAAADTFVYRATTDTLTNKTLDTAGAGNVLKINGTQVSAVSGTGNTAVLSASPTITGTLTASIIAPTTINAYTLGGGITAAGNNITGVGTFGATTINGFTLGGGITAAGNNATGFVTLSATNHASAGALTFQSNGSTFAGDITTGQQWFIGGTLNTPPTGPQLTVSKNVSALPALGTPTGISGTAQAVATFGGVDGSAADIVVQSFGVNPGIRLFQSGGTAAAQTATTATATVGVNFFYGTKTAGGTAYVAGGGLVGTATENWDATHSGFRFDLYATPTGTTGIALGASVGAGFMVGTTTDPGAGNIVATGKIRPGSFTVATLPSGSAGDTVFCSNVRVFNGAGVQEGAGLGSGGLVSYNGTAWKIAGTNITAVA